MQGQQSLERLAEVFVPVTEKDEEKERRRVFPIFIIFLLVWVLFVYETSKLQVELRDDIVEVEKLPERFAKIVVPKLVEEKKEIAQKKEEKKAEKKEEKKAEEQKPKEESAAMTKEQKKEIIREKVRQVGILALLTAKGEGEASPLAEVLGGGVVKNLDEILGGISGVRVAEKGEELKPLEFAGGIQKRGADVGALEAKGGREVGLEGKKVAAVTSKITTEAPEIEGKLDEETVRKVAERNQASLKYCFQKAQMRNPNLQGKIVVEIVVDPEGKVSNVSVRESTIDDQEMVGCVLRMIRRWQFPAPGGEVTIVFPLVFISMT
ncbi:MAG: AgmX/PglI C-terminal domain-containing protein [Candidatus Calescibacterium sp.]|jgi:TonB family protein|nr:AgmX/PglI C-terminal domain-containing protein [Candidatus Calescibacterium sp.]